MKFLGITLMLTLILIGIASAATDEEIINYAIGVFDAGSLLSGSNTIGIWTDNYGNTLFRVNTTLSKYSTANVGGIGYQIWDVSQAVEKIISKYPERFSGTVINIWDASGSYRGSAVIWAK
jgi:hypothetical protein